MSSEDIINAFIKSTEEVNSEIYAEFGKLTPDRLNWKPSSNRWSIAECIEHLIITNNLYSTSLTKAIRNNKAVKSASDRKFRHTLIGKMMIKYISPESQKNLPTSGSLKPSGSSLSPDVIDRFFAISKKLITLAEQLRTFDLTSVKFRSPVSSVVRLNAGDALIILMNHDRRHFNQMKKVFQELKNHTQTK